MTEVDARARRFVDECLHSDDNEAAAVLQLRVMLATGLLSRLLAVPAISEAIFEYRIPGAGIADLVLFHEGGGVTLIEAKGPESWRAVAGGIGQLFMYEAGLRLQLKRLGRPAPFVNRVLCAPLRAEQCMPVWEACQLAGIRLLHLTPLAELKASAERDKAELEGAA